MALTLLLFSANLSIAFAADPTLSKLVLSKNEVTVEVGESSSLFATAVMSDNSTDDVTIQTEWKSDKPEVASVYAGIISAKGEGTATITAIYSGQAQAVQVTVTKKVKALTKDKQKVDLRLGTSEEVTLTALYQDNSSEVVSDKADWSSSDPSVATVINGTVTGKSSGSATITAKYGKQSITLPVQVEVIRRLDAVTEEVSLLLKDTKKVEVMATYPDGTVKDVSAEAEWTTSNEKVADAINGVITAYGAGTATLTASYGTKTATIEVDVDRTRKLEVNEQSVFMRVNTSQKMVLTATYPDGRTEDITNLAKWTSDNEDVAYVSKGSISAYSTGAAVITAEYGTKSVKVQVDVETPRRLELSEEDFSLRTNEKKQLVLKATYANGHTEDVTAKANWSSSNEDVAYVAGGHVTAFTSGEAKVSASLGGKSASVTVDVDIPRKVKTEPETLVMQSKEQYQVQLIAEYADGNETVITDKAEWSTSSDKVATVENGKITAVASGEAKITAAFGNRKAEVKVEVDLAEKLEADARVINLEVNESQQITLTAVDSSGNKRVVTDEAEWKSNSAKTADVHKGLITAYGSGKATITATYGGKSVQVLVEIGILQKLEANVRSLSLKSGEKAQILLFATYSDGSKKDVTLDADWKAGSYKAVELINGQVTGTGYGKTTITGKFGNKSVKVSVDVDTLKYLQTDVVSLTLKEGATAKVTATATYADGTDRDVSVPALWTSSKILVADVKDGVIRANGKGKANITVSFGGKKTRVVVTVE